jgi:hypothetical protein
VPGELFTELYVQPGPRVPDDMRARRRIGSLFREAAFHGEHENVARFVEGRLGVRLEHGGDHAFYWDRFIQSCDIKDLLNTITLVYRFLQRMTRSQWWLAAIREIFSQQHLAYEIDDHGTVHPAVDQEFQRNRVSAIAALQSSRRYDNVRASFERVSTELIVTAPNYKEAWRATFGAVEALFKLMFPSAPQLNADRIRDDLGPLVQRVYAQDAVGRRAAAKLLAAFSDWVDGAHFYRHEQGAEEPAQPPSDVAILAISHGAGLLRWLVGLDQTQQLAGRV